jgi:hypothetical protein
MKFPQALLSFATLAVFSIPSFAASTTWVTIKDNPGGYVHEYRSTYRDYKRKGVNVRIDGECRSACTLVTVYVSADHICITPKAKLIFHSERLPDGTETSITSLDSLELTLEYPPYITNWLMNHGGSLTDTVVTIPYAGLHQFYVDCPSQTTP